MDEYEEMYPEDLDADAPEPTKKQIHRYIEQLLPHHRPKERYSSRDKAWMEPVIKLAYEEAKRHDLTLDGLLKDWCNNSVQRHEREASYAADKLMRKIGAQGQLPLDWGSAGWNETNGRLPLRLLGDERVPLGAADSSDIEDWHTANAQKTKRVSDAQDERDQARTFFKSLFDEQPKANRADQLIQPDDPDQDQDNPEQDQRDE